MIRDLIEISFGLLVGTWGTYWFYRERIEDLESMIKVLRDRPHVKGAGLKVIQGGRR